MRRRSPAPSRGVPSRLVGLLVAIGVVMLYVFVLSRGAWP